MLRERELLRPVNLDEPHDEGSWLLLLSAAGDEEDA